MKQALIQKPGIIETADAPIPEPASDETLIKVMASGICGTDIHIFRGEYFGDYPVVPGHEFAGIIEACGSRVSRFKKGDRVAVEPNIACDNCENCLNNRQNFCSNWQAVGVTRPGAMAEYVTAPEKNVFAIGNAPFSTGAFVEPLSCVLHGIRKTPVAAGDKICILGAGPIGLLLMKVLQLKGASQICVAEKNPMRLAAARENGADAVYSDTSELPADNFDVVVDATGVPALIPLTIDIARPGASILSFGVPPAGGKTEIEPFLIFKKGLRLIGSFTSVRNSIQAVRLLSSGKISVEELISHRLGLEELEKGIKVIESGEGDVMKVIIEPNGNST